MINPKPGDEIWVSEGTYLASYVNLREDHFQMYPGVKILGGFSVAAGVTVPASRDWLKYKTILTGEIQKDGDPTNNSYNVIKNFKNGLTAICIA